MGKVSRDTQTLRCSQKVIHIPYRDSKLTRILQDSLGGNAKTCLIATINPMLVFEDESINTLRFADRAHQVMTHAKINEIKVNNHNEMNNLQCEILRLKRLLQQHGIDDSQDSAMPQKTNLINFPSKKYPMHTLGHRCNTEDNLIVASEDRLKQYYQHQNHKMNFQRTNWHSDLNPLDITSKMQNNETCEKIIEVISSVASLVEELLKSNSLVPKVNAVDNKDQESRTGITRSNDNLCKKGLSEYQTKNDVPRNMLTSLLARRNKLKPVINKDEA